MSLTIFPANKCLPKDLMEVTLYPFQQFPPFQVFSLTLLPPESFYLKDLCKKKTIFKSKLTVFKSKNRNIQPFVPYNMKQLDDSLTFTFLDYSGRPTLHLYKENLLSLQTDAVTVVFSLPPFSIVREPIYFSLGFFSLFVIFIVLGRLDFSVGEKNWKQMKKNTTGQFSFNHRE